jgi:3'(2'), 5'-bisphosphate nucleotidase
MPTDSKPPRMLRQLIDAALAGGREALAVYRTDFAVSVKSDDTPVSEADRRAEAAILACLSRDFPDMPVVAEEAASAGSLPQVGRRFFLVDPLDGTKEFIARKGEFTVNVALVEDGAPVAGVVLAPALGRLCAAADGAAWCAAVEADCDAAGALRPIRVRPAPALPVGVASRSHSNPATERALAAVGVGERRSIGSSLKFCLVAEGEADFYPRLGPTMEWDTAAGDAVLRAAGGAVVTLSGTPLAYGKAVPGMRPFENPPFYAVGDAALLAGLGAREPA